MQPPPAPPQRVLCLDHDNDCNAFCVTGLVLQADVARAEDKNFLALSQVPLTPFLLSLHLPFTTPPTSLVCLPQALEKASLAPAIPALKAGALTSFSAKVPALSFLPVNCNLF